MTGDRRNRRAKAFRVRLLAGAALIVCAPFTSGAMAQTTSSTALPPVNDGLGADAVYVEADAATRTNDVITATGRADDRAYVRTRGHVLRGESLSYDLAQGTAAAAGNVE